ncbi:MAG: MBOAT family protein [Acidobacteria bacterium]|nr:MBOAT family protein [Acidobacteriota bacterium]
MNFTQFSFWWILAVVGGPALLARTLMLRAGLWRDRHDAVLLFALSSVLFWSASPFSFTIHLAELLVNYAVFRALPRVGRRSAYALAGAAIALDLSVLAYFKYADFLVRDVAGLLFAVRANPGGAIDASTLPPGISFYTFQVVAFMIDTARDPKAKPVALLDYLNFASFFPLVVAGPIERRASLLPQMQQFRWRCSASDIDAGLRWIALGAFAKFVLADNLALSVKIAETANPWIVLSSIYLFGLRIYFDFAGYSFIALGLGRLLGVRLTVNFLAPYSSTSIVEFWRRWHVSLSRWFRDYVYLPLGGSRHGLVALNLLIVFLVSGLWHGAGWNYVMWGAGHGLMMVAARALSRRVRVPRPAGWFLTFNAVMISWLLFMETDAHRLLAKIRTLLTPAAYSAAALQAARGFYTQVEALSLLITVGLAAATLLGEWRALREDGERPYEWLLQPLVAPALLGLSLFLSAKGFSEFVYFSF